MNEEALLEQVLAKMPANGVLGDEELLRLAALLGENTAYLTLEAALSQQHILCITARSSGRRCYEYSFAGARYLCFLSPLFCTCQDTLDALLQARPEPLLCKHLVAVKLALAANSTCLEAVSDADFAARVLECVRQ